MFNPVEVVISAFEERLRESYYSVYTILEPDYPGIISYVGNMALELIANGDAPYHDLNHTINVTLVGQQILKGKHLLEGGISPREWLHFIVSLLCHDIGYVRGVCGGDREGEYVIDAYGNTVLLEAGTTDASLTPYHVERGKVFVRERFADNANVDVEIVCANLEYTQFPFPEEDKNNPDAEFPNLVRGADLIGQLADPSYMRKTSSLFNEFQETGMNERLGYRTAADLRAAYPKFFWTLVAPYIGGALRYLRMTQEGQQYIANLYAHIFAEEHDLPSPGPQRITR